jgi:hypothetical protein
MKTSKTPSWQTKLTPIAQFLVDIGIIELDPVGQRLDMDSLTKKQGIIRSILSGQDICEIALREMSAGPYQFRSIDGGHRKRAIFNFFTNKFKTGPKTFCYVDDQVFDVSGMSYSELPNEVIKFFKEYKLRFVIYDKSMTDEQAGETFRLRNLSTNVNHQEMLNSYEDNLLAKFVREISRNIPRLNNRPHQLFSTHMNSKGEVKPIYFQKASERLSHDEFVARLLCLIVKNKGLTTSSFDELEEMYVTYGHPEEGVWAKDPSVAKKNQNDLKAALDFLLNYAEVRKRNNGSAGLTNIEAVMLSRFYINLSNQYGKNWKINNWQKFYQGFKTTFDSFVGKNPTASTALDLVYGTRTKAEAMKKHLAVFDVEFKVINSLSWLLEELEIKNLYPNNLGIVITDKVRGLSQTERETMWLNQDRKCFISGEFLPFEDSVAAHIEAHADGGKTTAENIVIVHKELNAKMGSMNLFDYKKLYLENRAG